MIVSKQHFEDFINAQPVDKCVDHNEGWDGCAVGDFSRTIRRNINNVVSELWREYGTNNIYIHSNHEVPTSLAIDPTLMDILNNHNKLGNTYGTLQDLIKELNHTHD